MYIINNDFASTVSTDLLCSPRNRTSWCSIIRSNKFSYILIYFNVSKAPYDVQSAVDLCMNLQPSAIFDLLYSYGLFKKVGDSNEEETSY